MMEKDGNDSTTSLVLDSASGKQQDEDLDLEDAAYGVDMGKENYEPERQSKYHSTDAPLYDDEDSDGEDEAISYR